MRHPNGFLLRLFLSYCVLFQDLLGQKQNDGRFQANRKASKTFVSRPEKRDGVGVFSGAAPFRPR